MPHEYNRAVQFNDEFYLIKLTESEDNIFIKIYHPFNFNRLLLRNVIETTTLPGSFSVKVTI